MRHFAIVVAGLVTGAVALLPVACGDSLHLDPGSAGGGSSSTLTTVGPGGSGGGKVGCISNADCPYPTPVCDTAQHVCVGCLEIADCATKPGTVCSKGACSCPVATDAFCDAMTPGGNRCVDLKTSPNDCGSCGHACFGACAAGKCVDPWEPTPITGAPDGRHRHVAVWTGTTMIVWGGATGSGSTSTGGIYDPAKHTWKPTSLANAPTARWNATAVWTGSVMIVFGGRNEAGVVGGGGAFDPAKNVWTNLPTAGQPGPRSEHTAIWADDTKKMVVWGGVDNMSTLSDGGIFDPTAGTWTPVSPGLAPSDRTEHTAIYSLGAGTPEMIVWGGYDNMGAALDTGAKLDVAQNSWSTLPTGPAPRGRHSAVWSGQQMLVFAGNANGGAQFLADGAKYNVNNSQWLQMGNAPEPRQGHSALWIGMATGRMWIFGGENKSGYLGTLWSYDSAGDQWMQGPTGPTPRSHHTAVTDGKLIYVWGGNSPLGLLNTGGVFDTTAM